MSISGIVFVIMAAVFATGANLIFKLAIQHAGGLPTGTSSEVLAGFVHLVFQAWFFAGLACFLLSSVTWFRVVATEPLSIAYPILVGLTFIMLGWAAAMLFDELITLRKVLGAAIILGGIILMSTGGGST